MEIGVAGFTLWQAGRDANADAPSREYMVKIETARPARAQKRSSRGWRGRVHPSLLAPRAGRSLLSEPAGWPSAGGRPARGGVGSGFPIHDRYDDRLPAPAWLYGIARNVLLGHLRSQHSIPAGDTGRRNLGEPDPWDAVDDRLDARRTVSGLTEALAALSDEDREVLLLVAWEQLTPAEVAVVLDIPPGTARSRLHRARTQLRGYLETSESPPRPYPNSSFHSAGEPALEVCDD